MKREFSAEAVRHHDFKKPPIGKRGYDEDEVDAYLQVIAAALDGHSRLSANEVHNVAFKKPPIGKRGYDEEEVDTFLDAIEIQLGAREGSSGAAADPATQRATPRAEAPGAANDRAADPARTAYAAWYEAKFSSTHPSATNPKADPPQGLRRLLRFGARARRAPR